MFTGKKQIKYQTQIYLELLLKFKNLIKYKINKKKFINDHYTDDLIEYNYKIIYDC